LVDIAFFQKLTDIHLIDVGIKVWYCTTPVNVCRMSLLLFFFTSGIWILLLCRAKQKYYRHVI